MSRLHTIRATISEVAAHFGVDLVPALAVPDETVEGLPGLVVLERDGRRLLKKMDWGFPRHTPESRRRGDPPGRVGLVADLTNPMWERLVAEPRYRCLIVLTHFANPDGKSGSKTRTWFSLNDPVRSAAPIMAWAGFCRNISGIGPVYAGMTMAANAAILPTNDRMPVLIGPTVYEEWLHCPIRDVIGFQFGEPLPPERMRVERTNERWRGGGVPAMSDRQFALL